MASSHVLYGVPIQEAAARGDLANLQKLHDEAVRQAAELKAHIETLSGHIASHGAAPSSIVPYGSAVQDAPVLQDRTVRPLYGVVDQASSAVPLYGVPPNPIPLYGVVIQDAAASGDLARMKAIEAAVERHLEQLDHLAKVVKKARRS